MPDVLTSARIAHKVVSPDQWLEHRKQLLTKEKELTRLRDDINRQRLELPWEKVEKHYAFEGPSGKKVSPIYLPEEVS